MEELLSSSGADADCKLIIVKYTSRLSSLGYYFCVVTIIFPGKVTLTFCVPRLGFDSKHKLEGWKESNKKG